MFCRLDVSAFEGTLAQWTQSAAGGLATSGEVVVIAVDGKARRGIHGEELPGVRLVAGYVHDVGVVAGQKGVGSGEGELTAGRDLTATLLPVAGNTITPIFDRAGLSIAIGTTANRSRTLAATIWSW